MPFAVADAALNRNDAAVATEVMVPLVVPGFETNENEAALALEVKSDKADAALDTKLNAAAVAVVVYPGGMTPKIHPELFPLSTLSIFAYHVFVEGVA